MVRFFVISSKYSSRCDCQVLVCLPSASLRLSRVKVRLLDRADPDRVCGQVRNFLVCVEQCANHVLDGAGWRVLPTDEPSLEPGEVAAVAESIAQAVREFTESERWRWCQLECACVCTGSPEFSQELAGSHGFPAARPCVLFRIP
jgi:hypothetical protein